MKFNLTIVLTFLFFNLTFCQTEKGTFYFKNNFAQLSRVNSSYNDTSFEVELGYFIRNNSSIGLKISEEGSTIFRLSYQRFLGPKKIRGTYGLQAGGNINPGYTKYPLELKLGGLFFIDDDIALNLTSIFEIVHFHSFEFLSKSYISSNWFDHNLKPQFKLGFTYFLRPNKGNDKKEKINSVNYLKRGTMSAGIYGLQILKGNSLSFLEVGGRYFFKDNFYSSLLSHGSFSTNFGQKIDFSYSMDLSTGYYLRFGDFVALNTQIGIDYYKLRYQNFESPENILTNLKPYITVSPTFLLHAHKVELFFSTVHSQRYLKEPKLVSETDINFNYGIDYEYFLTDKLSFNAILQKRNIQNYTVDYQTTTPVFVSDKFEHLSLKMGVKLYLK